MMTFRAGLLCSVLTALLLACGTANLIAAEATAETQETLVENFDSNDALPAGWKVLEGTWKVVDGALVAEALESDCRLLFGDAQWQNYELEATATFLEVANDNAWLGLGLRLSPEEVIPWSQVTVRRKTSGKEGGEFAVRLASGWSVRQRASAKTDCPLGQPIPLRVVVRNTTVEGYVDGKQLIDNAFCLERSRGCAGLAVRSCRLRLDNVRLRRLPDTPPELAIAVAPRPCLLGAHRGFSALAPENTLASARKALEHGADSIECDVYRTKDGALVLMHDDNVKRTTNGSGKIVDLTLEQIRQLDAGSWKGKEFVGERVPTLAEFLALQKDTGCRPMIEIKMGGISADVVEAIRAAGMVEQCNVIAFDAAIIKEVRQLEPRLRCGWLFGGSLEGTPAQRADWLAGQLKACLTDVLAPSYQILSPELVRELKQRGVSIWCWTVNDPLATTALAAWGVDLIETDRLDVMRAQLPRVK